MRLCFNSTEILIRFFGPISFPSTTQNMFFALALGYNTVFRDMRSSEAVYLADIFDHTEILNTSVQGKEENLFASADKVNGSKYRNHLST